MNGITQPIHLRQAAVGHRWLPPRRALFLFDILSVFVSLIATQVFMLLHPPSGGTARFVFLAGNILFALIMFLLLLRDGQYTMGKRFSRLSDIGGLARSLILAAAFTLLVGFLTKGFFTGFYNPSRLVAGGGFAVLVVLTLVSRVILAAYQNRMFANGDALRRVLVLGVGKESDDFIGFVESRPWLGIGCVGRLVYGTRATGSAVNEGGKGDEGSVHLTSSLAGLEALDRAIRQSGAQEVIVALDEEDRALLPGVTKLLSLAHVHYRIIPTLFECTFRNARLDEFVELPVIDVEVDPSARAQRSVKRAIDVSMAMLVGIITLPITLAVVLAILVEDGRPILFSQERVGRNGRRFQMLKFRTMCKDAEQRLADLQAKNEAGSDLIFKIKEDPRITRVGKWLRKLSLDELPQVINVLLGDMSIVGPRPPLPREVEKYEEQHFCRLKGLPGITGLWQVSGRSNLSFDEMVKLDRYYLENWSLALDLRIIVKTFVVVFARRGAY